MDIQEYIRIMEERSHQHHFHQGDLVGDHYQNNHNHFHYY